MAASGTAHTALDEKSDDGAFKRVDSVFRNFVEEGGQFPPEAGRYRLYISYACPWASRCIAMLHLKGLQDTISLSVVHPTWQPTRPDDPEDKHTGWVFRAPGDAPLVNTAGHGEFPCDAALIPDPNGCASVRELYELSKDTLGKYSVPILWDDQTKTIVNNESAEIVRIFNSAFQAFATNPELDVYPEDLRAKIDETNEWVYTGINNGVYKSGFAQKQGPYEQASKGLHAALDRAEDILSKQRYICGSRFTEADIRLFVTLIRFDEVYVVYFKCNQKNLREYPNLLNYVRDIYQMAGVKDSVNMAHIKTHYFSSHPVLNTFGIIPVGPGVDFEAAHGRDKQF